MKHLSILIGSFVAVGALLFTGCDQNSVIQQDNTPPQLIKCRQLLPAGKLQTAHILSLINTLSSIKAAGRVW